jgi:protein TonB
MFKNLIESSSHTQEYKRRGSFLLFTGAVYVVLFVVTGVVSIYAYDARLDAQILDYEVTMLPPTEVIPDVRPVQPAVQPDRPRDTNNNDSRIPERAVAMLDTDRPEVVPDTVSATRSPNLPLPPGPVRITGRDVPGSIPGPANSGGNGRPVVQSTQIVEIGEPPPAPDPPKPPKVVSKGVINGQAIVLPKPNYPEMAKRIRLQGTVNVQVLIDEQGRVISAKAISGSPFLTVEAQRAAMGARFSPTKLGDQPVKVSGIITYNFVLSN